MNFALLPPTAKLAALRKTAPRQHLRRGTAIGPNDGAKNGKYIFKRCVSERPPFLSHEFVSRLREISFKAVREKGYSDCRVFCAQHEGLVVPHEKVWLRPFPLSASTWVPIGAVFRAHVNKRARTAEPGSL